MTVTRAFDLALFVDTPVNLNDGALVNTLGPPFTATFKPVVVGATPGITVGASMPKATAQNQIMISGVGPTFAWALGTNPAAAASVPAPAGQYSLLMADAVPSWQNIDIPSVMTLGNAVTTTLGGTFASAARLTFTPTAAMVVYINGGNPNFASIDNFTLDCGTF